MNNYSKPKGKSSSFSRSVAKCLLEFSSRVEHAGETFSGINKPKRTPNHPKKSHAVLVKDNGKNRIVRFGQQGVKGSPKKEGESEAYRKRRESFRSRHARNIKKGRTSAAFWANSVKW